MLKEWVRARVKQYEDAKAAGKPLNKATIDMKWIEFEIDTAVIEAFDETVAEMQSKHGAVLGGEDVNSKLKRTERQGGEAAKKAAAEGDPEREKVEQLQRQMTLQAKKEEEAKNPLTSKAKP